MKGPVALVATAVCAAATLVLPVFAGPGDEPIFADGFESGGIHRWSGAHLGPWDHYPYQAGVLTFPEDEGHHPDLASEWWYVNAHLVDEQGGDWDFFVSFFEDLLVLGGVSWPDWGGHLPDVRLGQTTTATGALQLLFADGYSPVNRLAQVTGEPWVYDLLYSAGGNVFDLHLTALKPPHALAGTGLVQQLDGVSTYYYCQPRVLVEGTVTAGYTAHQVTGRAWIDRQFYPSQEGEAYLRHIWFAIHLDDGVDIAAYQVTAADGTVPFPLFDVIGANGEFVHFTEFGVEWLEEFRSARCGTTFPRRVRVVHEPTGTDLELATTVLDPTIDAGELGCFMEGPFSVSGLHAGAAVSGEAYVEVIEGGARLGRAP